MPAGFASTWQAGHVRSAFGTLCGTGSAGTFFFSAASSARFFVVSARVGFLPISRASEGIFSLFLPNTARVSASSCARIVSSSASLLASRCSTAPSFSRSSSASSRHGQKWS